MQSRRDHLYAYQFAVERLARAAVSGQTGVGDAPMRRSGLGTSIGVGISVLLCVVAFVYGLISPAPSTAWRDSGAIIVVKETGTRYLLLGGELRPTANYASAVLVAGQTASVQLVPRAQLAGIPVGAEIGIPGAPQDVPAATSLLPGTWAICAQQNGDAVLDLDPAGHTAPGPAGERVFVASTDGSGQSRPAEYLVWDSVKYPLPGQSMLSAVGLADQQPSRVAPAWLSALPTGPAVAPPAVPSLGEPGPSVMGGQAPVGTLYSTLVGGDEEDYILLSDGLAPISHTEAGLFELAGLGNPRQISTASIAAAPISADHALLTMLPDFLSGPVFNSAGAALCVRQSAPGSDLGSQVVTEDASTVAADPAVVLPPGYGMLVEPPGQSALDANPVVFLVTDTGQRYLVDSTSALDALGYASVAKVVMPSNVLGLIPSGPNLDVDAAAQDVPWQSG